MAVPPPARRTPEPAARVLGRLAALARELAGAYRPATVVDLVARALRELLPPGRLTIVLLDVEATRLIVAHDSGPSVPPTDDPLLQLALRRGPLHFPRDVAAAAGRFKVEPRPPVPGSWLGVPVVAVSRAIGAVTLAAERPGALGEGDLLVLSAVVAQAAIALENARLFELLSSGKREWELTVDAITHAICIVDPLGKVRRANQVFADLVRQPVTALPGRPWLELLPAAWADPVARALVHAGSGPLEIRAGERVLLVSAVAMPGAPAGATVLMFEDHTDKRRLQDQLIQSEKMSAIGQLIAGVAHDLNNPLASVVGFSDFLAEAGEVPPALAEPLRVIRQEAERAANIVKNLLSFARRQEAERTLQPIRPILESTLALLRNELMARKVETTLEVEPDLPDVEVNGNQIKQVFVNLISNAAQAIAGTGGGRGRVWITARKWLDGLAVSVVDDGPGMPEEIAGRVFEPFFTTKAEGEGTGLGLSICQGIAKEHGGRITVETSPGAGATFTVELPGSTHAAHTSTPSAAPGGGGRLRILVVDDEPHILHYMRATLESWGHLVELASDGSEALDRALAQPFDVIICDLRMPRLGGREVFHSLRHEHPEVAERIIFATGDTVRGDTLAFLAALKRPYLRKPFTLAELRSALGSVVPRTP